MGSIIKKTLIKRNQLSNIAIIVNDNIEKIIKRKNIIYKEFEIGIFFSSNFYGEYLFNIGLKELNNDPLFFSPMIFSNNIQNSILSSINKKFKFRGEAISLFNRDKMNNKEIRLYTTNDSKSKKTFFIELIKRKKYIYLYITFL